MALAGQNQVRQMYVSEAYPKHLTVAAIKAGANGDLTVLSANGTAVGAGKPFVFMQKTAAGVATSFIINPKNVTRAASRKNQAQAKGKYTLSAITAITDKLYTVEIVIKGFGSLSPENEYVKKAFYKAKSGDSAESIVDGLISALNRNFKREEPVMSGNVNPYFAFTKTGSGSTAALVIEEKTDWVGLTYRLGRHTRIDMPFEVNYDFPGAVTLTKTTAAKSPIGDGYTVADMEWYLKGERNDPYREMGAPHNFQGSYFASTAKTYNFIDIEFFDEGRDEAKKSKKQITIAMPALAVPNTAFNDMVANLNTILGAGTVALVDNV